MALGLAGCLGLAMGLAGYGNTLDQTLRQVAWTLHRSAASGSIHLVEIDAQSLAAIDRWPWPRRNYAVVVDRLRQAGAASVSFDVDFSSPSNPADDQALAEAIARANGAVALPTFVQQAGSGSAGWIESRPIPILRQDAVEAAVSVLPDRDGTVRRMPLGVSVSATPRPSLSALVAGASGTMDQDFPVDFAIDPDTIPRHSFIDVRDGRFDPGTLRGKHVIVGATAVELGDRYAVPLHGVIPGVLIQALASETLLGGVPREASWQLPLAIALLGGGMVLRARSWRGLAARWLAGPMLALGAAVLLDRAWHWTFVAAPAAMAWLVMGAAAAGMRLVVEMRRRQAHDSQTGMPNRLALDEDLRTGSHAGLMSAQIVELEKISASLGGPGTIALVQRIRDRIATVVPDRTVYRIEDRILAWRCIDRAEVERQVATLRTFMMAPFEIDGRRIDVKLGLGFAPETADGSESSVIENAMLAVAQGIAEGRNWHEFSAADADAADLELSLLGELDEAIANGDILTHYQPKLDLRSNRIVSVEALVRWHHPLRGFLRPDEFVPLAERDDRIGGLTLHVVGLALADLKDWNAAGHSLTTAVNISAKLLRDRAFIERLRTMIERSGVPSSSLTLEVTELAAMDDPASAAEALRSFRAMGIAISMDDYGTGHSTLSNLRTLALNELKIDRSFVQFAHQNRADGALVRSTVDLAHELGLKVVAEGVEDEECLKFLSAIGCDLAQGYLISKPVPATELIQLLAGRKAAA